MDLSGRRRVTGQCPVCWELVAAEPGSNPPVAKSHERPAVPGRPCDGSGQPLERAA